MKVLIDADTCPVTSIAVSLCQKKNIECILFCDTAHQIQRDGAITIVIDKGADSTDFALANRVETDDIIVTQDYGLASMCLAKGGRVLHQDGWEYTQRNIDALLFERHEARKFRASGGRTKGPKKRTSAQDQAFSAVFSKLLQG